VQATGPKISELFARRQLDRAAVIYQTATGWMVGLAWPIYLTLAIFAPVLVRVFGPEFEAGAVPLRIAAIAMLVAAAAGPVDMILLMAGRSTWNLANTVVALGANIVLNFLLIPRLGLAGAAIAWGVSIATNNLLPLTQVWFTMHLHPFGRGMLRASASSALCYGGLGLLAVWLADDSLVAFLAFGVAATALYGALLWRSRDAMQIMALGDALKVRRLRPRAAVR
jgi:O-antigen/teichoic acid export membrane protein